MPAGQKNWLESLETPALAISSPEAAPALALLDESVLAGAIRMIVVAGRRLEAGQGITVFVNGQASAVWRWGSYRFETPEDLAHWILSGELPGAAYAKFTAEANAS